MEFICILGLEVHKDIVVAIISAGIPSGIAWLIFKKWGNQKGTEVVANEIKNIIKDLLEATNIAYQMNSYTASSDFNVEKIKQFKILDDRILRSSLFIDKCIVVDNLNSLLQDFHEQCLSVIDIELDVSPIKNNLEFKEKVGNKVNDIGKLGLEMVNILLPYSTYQETFIFKKKS